MIKTLFLVLALALNFDDGPTIAWQSTLLEQGSGAYELVLTGTLSQDCYTHPMGESFAGTTLEIAPAPGLSLLGPPQEEYDPSDYKGSRVIRDRYVIRQAFRSEGAAEIAGTVTWSACSGDACYMPEEWSFREALPQGPVLSETSSGAERGKNSLWALILEAILWGFAMLLTPCVFPMVPMTVSFFMRGSDSPSQGRWKAFLYGLSIVLLYTVPICLIIGITWLLGGEGVTADIFNWLATHWLPNLLFFIIFMIFAASFFGAFEITLPSSWVNRSDRNSDRQGFAGIFFLALTLVLVSFSCTGPIVGTVLIKSTSGEFWTPMVTMLAFSIAFALPFTLLALFPSLLKKLPKSGGWLNSVKVVLGFIELALGFKFLSVADQTYHWHLLDREVYLAIWIAIFSLLGLYLIGKIRFKNDEPVAYLGVGRLGLAIAVFAFVVYLIPGMWGAPLKALSGYLPPIETQDFVLDRYQGGLEAAPAALPEGDGMVPLPHGLVGYDSIDGALEAARAEGKRVFVDISGRGCVNCREMEARVWSDPQVRQILHDDYVIAVLYVDDKTRLDESRWLTTESGRVLKDVGRVNSYIALTRFGVNAQPNYALLSDTGELLVPVRGYDLSVSDFVAFLKSGLQ